MIYLFRHTKPDVAPGTCYGVSDVGLERSFTRELAVVKSKVKGVVFDRVFSSPLRRCTVLAAALRCKTGVVTDHRIKEIDFGSWEMRKWGDIPPADVESWCQHFTDVPVPGGESHEDLRARVLDFWGEYSACHDGNVAIVCHAGPMRVLLSHLLEIPPGKVVNLQLPYGQVIKLQHVEGEHWLVTIM